MDAKTYSEVIKNMAVYITNQPHNGVHHINGFTASDILAIAFGLSKEQVLDDIVAACNTITAV